jgi:WD repeat-containing protein 61
MFRPSRTVSGAHSDGIWSACWTSSNKILTGSVDETVKSWTPGENGVEKAHEMGGHQLGVISMVVNRDGSECTTSSLDSQIRVWDVEQGQLKKTIDAGPVETWGIALHPAGVQVASGSQSGNVNIWNLKTGLKEASIETRGSFVMSVAFSPDGKMVATGGHDGVVHLIDVEAGKVVHKLEAHSMPVRSLTFQGDDGSSLLTASDDTHINLFDVGPSSASRAPQMIATMSGHSSWVLSICSSPDGQHFATSGSDRKVKIWDLPARQCVHTFDNSKDQVWCTAYNEDGSQLAAGCDDGTLEIYEVR